MDCGVQGNKKTRDTFLEGGIKMKTCPFRLQDDSECGYSCCALYNEKEGMCSIKSLAMSFEYHLPVWLASMER